MTARASHRVWRFSRTGPAAPARAPLVFILAGGTGGHVFPGLALADVMRRRGWQVEWVGSRHGLENDVVPAAGIALHRLPVRGLRGTGWTRWALAPWTLGASLWAALALTVGRRPDAAIAFGGFAAGPGGVMASALSVPLVVHEQNAVAGRTNRWLARVADAVFAAFPGTGLVLRGTAAEVIGNPVRPEIAAVPDVDADRPGPLNLLILGGSLGARRLNTVVPRALASLAPALRPNVWHQTGMRGLDEACAAYAEAGWPAPVERDGPPVGAAVPGVAERDRRQATSLADAVGGQAGPRHAVTPFIDDMAAALAWADVVLCRAGALTVSELAAAGRPALFVPYPHAVDDHQWANASEAVDAGAAWRVRDETLDEATVREWWCRLDRADLARRARAMRGLHRAAAAERIADRVEALAGVCPRREASASDGPKACEKPRSGGHDDA